jgi:hypothetical protein
VIVTSRKFLSSEKYDMPCPKSTTPQLERHGTVIDMHSHGAARSRGAGPALQCVSSGYMSGGCSCPRTVPAGVVRAAWLAELERGATGDSFFQAAWGGQTWLAFGLEDGQIRGVYCPAHRAEREARFAGLEGQHYAPAAASA